MSDGSCIELDFTALVDSNSKYIGVSSAGDCLLHNQVLLTGTVRCIGDQTKVCMSLTDDACIYHGGIDLIIVGSINGYCM